MTGITTWWLGLTDFSHEGRWIWSHSSLEAVYTAWTTGSPDASENNLNDCVSMAFEDGYLWKDQPCYEKIRAAPLCQKHINDQHTTFTSPSPTSPSTSSSTGSPQCYREYAILAESWRRVNYSPGGQDFCDERCDQTLLTGWYRFVEPAGVRLPTEPPKEFGNHCDVCQTAAAAWVEESEDPIVGDPEKDINICFAWKDEKCKWSIRGKSVACLDDIGSTVYLYYLHSAPG